MPPVFVYPILDSYASNQLARSRLRIIMASLDQAQHLMPLAIATIGLEPLVVAVGIDDPGDFAQMAAGVVPTAQEINIEFNPYRARRAQTKDGAEVCG